jgi:hypothetical protein
VEALKQRASSLFVLCIDRFSLYLSRRLFCGREIESSNAHTHAHTPRAYTWT